MNTAIFLVFVSVVLCYAADPPYGKLSINGAKLTDANGNTVQLRGMSLFWSVWMDKYWNQETIHVCFVICADSSFYFKICFKLMRLNYRDFVTFG